MVQRERIHCGGPCKFSTISATAKNPRTMKYQQVAILSLFDYSTQIRYMLDVNPQNQPLGPYTQRYSRSLLLATPVT